MQNNLMVWVLVGLGLLIGVAAGHYIGYGRGYERAAAEYFRLLSPEDDGGEMVFCAQDARECPDGSYVGRTGPNCEFAPCP